MYSFSYLEPVCCSMSSSNCCFLTCIQVSQEAGQVVCIPISFRIFHSLLSYAVLFIFLSSKPVGPLLCFLFLWVFLFQIFCLSGIIQYVTSVVCLQPFGIFLRFIDTVACIRIHSLLCLNDIPLYEYTTFIHPSGWQTLGLFLFFFFSFFLLLLLFFLSY